MSVTFYASAGATLEVSAGEPATQDETGYAALSYTQVASLVTMGEVGPTYSTVTVVPLETGVVEKAAGQVDYGQQEITMKYTPTPDAGVAILKTAAANRAFISVKETLPDGAVNYYQAFCNGVRQTRGGADVVIGYATTLPITTAIVEVAAPS